MARWRSWPAIPRLEVFRRRFDYACAPMEFRAWTRFQRRGWVSVWICRLSDHRTGLQQAHRRGVIDSDVSHGLLGRIPFATACLGQALLWARFFPLNRLVFATK